MSVAGTDGRSVFGGIAGGDGSSAPRILAGCAQGSMCEAGYVITLAGPGPFSWRIDGLLEWGCGPGHGPVEAFAVRPGEPDPPVRPGR